MTKTDATQTHVTRPDATGVDQAGTGEGGTASLGGRRLALFAVAGAAGALLGLAGVYGIGALKRNAADGECAPAVATAQRLAPLAHGEVAALALAERPLEVPDLAFHDLTGAERRLSDWRGRTVLVNLWATWCVPCRKEMPALDALEGTLGSPHFEVVAINIDTRATDKPHAWLEEVGVKRLAYYADPSAKVFQDLKLIGGAFGLPTTLLVDPSGCEIGNVAGPAEWASHDGIDLMRAAIGG
jgi:thiol-disulfide isomerase/thioredoxin